MASPALITQHPVTKSTLSYAKIVVQQHNEIEKPITSGKRNNENQNADLQQKSTTNHIKDVKNKSIVGRVRDLPFKSHQQPHHNNSTSSSNCRSDTIMKNVQGEHSSSKPEPFSSRQVPSSSSSAQEISPHQDDTNGEFETVVGKRHANSMKNRDNNIVSGRGKYNNNYRGYRRPFHENRNIEKSNNIAPKVVTNGSVCSETSSNSSTDGHLASIISDDNGHASASNSTESAGENDTCENSEEGKVKYVDAPPPAVNPWQVNSNVSTVIAKIRKPPSSLPVKKDERTPVVIVAPQTFADTVISSRNELRTTKVKGRPYPPCKQIETFTTEEDWPALDEAVQQQQSTPPKSAMDIKLVRFASSATESTDDELLSSPQNPLSHEKWPSISAASNGESKNSPKSLEENEATPTVICIELEPTNEVTAGASSRDGDISGEEPTAEESVNKKKNTKASRPKWVPLSLPETGTNKPKSPRRDRPVDRSSAKFRSSENSDSNNGRPGGSDRGGGRGRGSMGSRGRGGVRNGARYNHQSFHKEPYDSARHLHREDYTDYPPDFTTLSPMYLSEFIMPYVAHSFVPPTFVAISAPPPLADPESSYTIGEDIILVEHLKKQIEYYFSEENLEKDFFLRRKMDADGYLPVRLISSFHRVKNMTHDYGLVVKAIRLSSELELREDMSCVRTVTEPTKWPILGPAMPLPLSAHQTLMMPTSSGVLIPLPTNGIVNHNNNNNHHNNNIRLPSESGEMLNPNVPEFFPTGQTEFLQKSCLTTSEAGHQGITIHQKIIDDKMSTFDDNLFNNSTNIGNGDTIQGLGLCVEP